MFKLLNNAGNKYKKAIYYYMKRIIKDEDIPRAFNLTWLIAIWKEKGMLEIPQDNSRLKTIGSNYPASGKAEMLGSKMILQPKLPSRGSWPYLEAMYAWLLLGTL